MQGTFERHTSFPTFPQAMQRNTTKDFVKLSLPCTFTYCRPELTCMEFILFICAWKGMAMHTEFYFWTVTHKVCKYSISQNNLYKLAKFLLAEAMDK